MDLVTDLSIGTYVCGSLIQNAESACEPWSQGTFDTIAQALQTYDAGVLLHVGDLAYAVGYQWVRHPHTHTHPHTTQAASSRALQTWEQFMVAIEPIATQLPYMVGIGNHEYDYLAQPFRPWWSNYMGARNLLQSSGSETCVCGCVLGGGGDGMGCVRSSSQSTLQTMPTASVACRIRAVSTCRT